MFEELYAITSSSKGYDIGMEVGVIDTFGELASLEARLILFTKHNKLTQCPLPLCHNGHEGVSNKESQRANLHVKKVNKS